MAESKSHSEIRKGSDSGFGPAFAVKDAFRCYMGTKIGTLVVGNAVLQKEAQASSPAEDCSSSYELN